MRTKRRMRGVKVCSCDGMKLVRYAMAVCAVVLMASCGNAPKAQDEPEISSWSVYCNKYDVDPVNPTEEQEDYWADCYCGSTEEECDIDSIAKTLHQ